MPTIRAIYENGVFRPLDPLDLPEGTKVTLEILRVEGAKSRDDDVLRDLRVAFDQVDRGEVGDLDMDALLAEAHRRYAARR